MFVEAITDKSNEWMSDWFNDWLFHRLSRNAQTYSLI